MATAQPRTTCSTCRRTRSIRTTESSVTQLGVAVARDAGAGPRELHQRLAAASSRSAARSWSATPAAIRSRTSWTSPCARRCRRCARNARAAVRHLQLRQPAQQELGPSGELEPLQPGAAVDDELVRHAGHDDDDDDLANAVPLVTFDPNFTPFTYQNVQSNYTMQLSFRYSF